MNGKAHGRAGRPAGDEAARRGTGEADLTVMLAAHDAFRRDLRELANIFRPRYARRGSW